MNRKRMVYLAKCSKREKFLRSEINACKRSIKFAKQFWRDSLAEVLMGIATPDEREALIRNRIRDLKWQLSAYRHELARLKGMDRVTMPYKMFRFGFSVNVPKVSYYCECLTSLNGQTNYCPSCGRRILWEKVGVIA